MALFDLTNDPTDQAASSLVIDLNIVSAVLDADLDQDEDGTYVVVILEPRYDQVPETVAKRIYGEHFAIADVSEREEDDSLVVEVRP